ncbi:ferritin family protein [Jatrophihabitans fulvus]
MPSSFDEARFRELMVESEDLQSDAMKGAKTDLDDYVAAALEARYVARNDDRPRPRPSRSGIGVGGALVGAGALGLAGLALAGPASAAQIDVQVLQTAASLENLAVATYKKALTLPFIGGGSANPVVKAFAQKTQSQHAEHAQAFNAAVKKLGGKEQNSVNPTYNKVVQSALPGIKGPGDVVSLAVTLEDIATQTYVKNVSQVSTKELRQLFGSVAGVEAQHKAVLLAVGALLTAAPAQIKLPPDAAKLPAAAGKVGFPDAFFPTKKAAPATSGQVK